MLERSETPAPATRRLSEGVPELGTTYSFYSDRDFHG